MRNEKDNKNNIEKIKSYFNNFMDTIKQDSQDSNELLIKTLNEADKNLILSKIEEYNQVTLLKEQLNKMQDNINLVIANQLHIQESMIHLATNIEEMMHHLEECGIIPNNELSEQERQFSAIDDVDDNNDIEEDKHMYYIDVNKELNNIENNKYKKDDVIGQYNNKYIFSNRNMNKKIDIN